MNDEKKPATKPWNMKGGSPNQWAPDYLRLAKKNPGFRCKWVRQDNVERMTYQGWSLCKPKDYGVLTDRTISDATPISDRIQRRELILMEIPEEMAEQREAYIENKNSAALKSANDRAKQKARQLTEKMRERGMTHRMDTEEEFSQRVEI